MKVKLFLLSILNISTLFLDAEQFSKAMAQSQVAPVVQKAPQKSLSVDENILGKLGSIVKYSSSRRYALSEQLHGMLTKSAGNPKAESILWAALGAIHSIDENTQHVSPYFIAQAAKAWPEFRSMRELSVLWNIFSTSYEGRSALDETSLIEIARTIDSPGLESQDLPHFAFYRGVGAFEDGNYEKALSSFLKVPLDSPDYRRSKFFEAICLLNLGKMSESKNALQIVVSLEPTAAEQSSSITGVSIKKLRELAVLTLARLYYEQGQFLEALAYYRTLAQGSFYFYDSLNEQGWAFFMAGFPNRSLGATYAASSPFFAHRFNPEAQFMMATVQYWMCNFEVAKEGIQRFIKHSIKEGDKLRNIVSRYGTSSSSETLLRYAQLFENSSRGASHANLELGQKTMENLKSNSLLNDLFKSEDVLIQKRLKLQDKERHPLGKERILSAFIAIEKQIKHQLGIHTQKELVSMNSEFEKWLAQARFLYLEILTAKKDSILGKERSVKGAEFVGEEKEFVETVGKEVKKWNQDKNEYWFDELGSYVFQVKTACGIKADRPKVGK
jgi:tetratricopeptide (TPR) repeat protein